MKIKKRKSVKKIMVIAGGVIIIGIIAFVLSYTYTVSGKVTDISSKQPVKSIKIAVAGHSQETNEQGDYKISNIKIYERRSLVVTAPEQYEKQGDIQISYTSRKVQKDFTVEPTLTETTNRDLIAGKNGQYDYLWDLLHPDDRAYWGSKEEYINTLKKRDDIAREASHSVKSETIGKNIRKLDTWKSEVTGKEYKEVMEVPIEEINVDNGKEQPNNYLHYYQRIDGYYHYFTGVNKDDIKKAIDAYNALKSL